MANHKPPAFQFYVNDWLSSPNVRMMTPEQRGCYIHLLAASWPDGIPYDTDYARGMLWALAGMPDASSWHAISEPVLAQFEVVDGCLQHAKLVAQFKSLDAYHRMQKDKAKKGAHARWHSSGKDQAMPKDASSSSASISSSTSEENSHRQKPSAEGEQGDQQSPKKKTSAFDIED